MNNQRKKSTSIILIKKFWLISSIVFIGMLWTGCTASKYTGETVSYKKAQNGLIYLKSGGYGKTKSGSVNNAIDNAFKNLFLQGIPNSNQSTPMLGNNPAETFGANKRFFDRFFEQEKEQFILDRSVSNFKFLNINSPSTEITMTVNLQSLRQHLIQNKILKGFGL